MSNDSIIIPCPACGTKNRIPQNRLLDVARCGHCKKSIPPIPTKPVTVNATNFNQEVLQSPIPVLVDFWAAWCGPCLMIAPDLERLAIDFAGKIKVAKVDSDQNQDLAGKYSIQAIPTLLVFNKGKLIERQTGVLPFPQLKTFVEKVMRN